MPSILFEQHLQATSPGLKGPDELFLQEDAEDLTELFRTFANGIEEDADLGDAFDCFVEYFEFNPKEAEWMRDVLCQVTEDVYGEPASDDNVKSLLADLSKPYPNATATSPNAKGFSPLPGELAIKRFLKSLNVAAAQDPYNNQSFKAERYKAFSRSQNRYGVDYSYDNDFNNQSPSRPLANPILNVAEVFSAVDSVGMGVKNQHRVLNTLTGEYCSPQINKEDAEQIAWELNQNLAAEVEQLEPTELHESSPTRKHFQQVADVVKAIKDEPTRQAVADHHASIFSQQNSRFDHDKFHAACGTKTKKERGLPTKMGEATTLPQTAIQENVLNPLSPQFIAAFKKANQQQNYTMAGSISQSGYGTSQVADMKAAALLVEQRKAKFGEDNGPSEHNAITAQSQKALNKKRNKDC